MTPQSPEPRPLAGSPPPVPPPFRSAALALPTPLVELELAVPDGHGGGPASRLLVKNDGLTHPVYGGNKPRRLVRFAELARERGAERLLTVGAAGSHHVLATAVIAREFGLRAAAVLVPQPHGPHPERVLRAAVAAGLEWRAARNYLEVPLALARERRTRDYFVPLGGSNAVGALEYVTAFEELLPQLRERGGSLPDTVVVPVGSGGTQAGIAAGVVCAGLMIEVLGVQVVGGAWPRIQTRRFARQALALRGAAERRGALRDVLRFDEREVGDGYGVSTPRAEAAIAVAAGAGLSLEPTYTGKAFAVALDRVRAGQRVLYWHTLSEAPLDPLLQAAPPFEALPLELRNLFEAAAQ